MGALRVGLRNRPNRASKAGAIPVALTKNGESVEGAQVSVTLTMLDMGSLSALPPQTASGRYHRLGPILGMSGRSRINLAIEPRSGKSPRLAVLDRVAP